MTNQKQPQQEVPSSGSAGQDSETTGLNLSALLRFTKLAFYSAFTGKDFETGHPLSTFDARLSQIIVMLHVAVPTLLGYYGYSLFSSLTPKAQADRAAATRLEKQVEGIENARLSCLTNVFCTNLPWGNNEKGECSLSVSLTDSGYRAAQQIPFLRRIGSRSRHTLSFLVPTQNPEDSFYRIETGSLFGNGPYSAMPPSIQRSVQGALGCERAYHTDMISLGQTPDSIVRFPDLANR